MSVIHYIVLDYTACKLDKKFFDRESITYRMSATTCPECRRAFGLGPRIEDYV